MRISVVTNKSKRSRPKRSQTIEAEEKPERAANKIDEKIRLAAKGVRKPIVGELPSNKILQEFRSGSTRTKKGSFFLCC
jgi:hypothetical protein